MLEILFKEPSAVNGLRVKQQQTVKTAKAIGSSPSWTLFSSTKTKEKHKYKIMPCKMTLDSIQISKECIRKCEKFL